MKIEKQLFTWIKRKTQNAEINSSPIEKNEKIKLGIWKIVKMKRNLWKKQSLRGRKTAELEEEQKKEKKREGRRRRGWDIE